MRDGLTNEKFCDVLKDFEGQLNTVAWVHDALNITESNLDKLTDSYFDLMGDFFELNMVERDLLGWFCFTADFGKRCDDGDVQVDGEMFTLWDSDDFWDLLHLGAEGHDIVIERW